MNDFASFVQTLLDLINPTVRLLVAVSLAIFLYGVVRYIYAAGNSTAKGEGRTMMFWGGIALLVMVSIWGIVNLFASSLFSGSSLGGTYRNTGITPSAQTTSSNTSGSSGTQWESLSPTSVSSQSLTPINGFSIPTDRGVLSSTEEKARCNGGSASFLGQGPSNGPDGEEIQVFYYQCK